MKKTLLYLPLWIFQKLKLISKKDYDNYRFNIAFAETGVKIKEVKINGN